jgi:hypothetical protein
MTMSAYDEDPLSPARGVLIGLVVGAGLWAVLLGLLEVARMWFR